MKKIVGFPHLKFVHIEEEKPRRRVDMGITAMKAKRLHNGKEILLDGYEAEIKSIREEIDGTETVRAVLKKRPVR